MGRILHCCLDIRGAMRWPKRQLGRMFRDENGSYVTAEAAWSQLADELAKGHKVLPMCDCPDFNYETGCPGKETAPPNSVATGNAPKEGT